MGCVLLLSGLSLSRLEQHSLPHEMMVVGVGVCIGNKVVLLLDGSSLSNLDLQVTILNLISLRRGLGPFVPIKHSHFLFILFVMILENIKLVQNSHDFLHCIELSLFV